MSAVLVQRREYERERNPDLLFRDQAILKDGPRAYKVATHWTVVNRNTGEIHHHALRLETYRHRRPNRRQDGSWILDVGYTISLTDEKGDEIGALLTFLRALADDALPDGRGDYLVVPLDSGADPTSIHQVLDAVSDAAKAELLAEVIAATKGDPSILHAVLERAAQEPEVSRSVAAALSAASFTAALKEFEELIDRNAPERAFQRHLQRNPWMFGSEYSELVDRRVWTRDREQDFMLRRTVDGYLEIVEIKTPLDGQPLFRYDGSHDAYYARSELTKVVGQVIGYLDDIDAYRFSIEARDRESVSKIRAKIIIGRDGDEGQREALRAYNGHLHRIEVLTFDQLVRIARQVLGYLERAIGAASET